MRVLFVNIPGQKPLPEPPVLNTIVGSARAVSVTDSGAALAVLRASGTGDDIAVMVSNTADLALFDGVRASCPKCKTILFTPDTMDRYSALLDGREDQLVDHLIANRLPLPFSVDELRVTLQKLLRHDVFGIGKYLAPGTCIQSRQVTSSVERDIFNADVAAYAEDCRLGQYTSKLIYGISEELLMNAIYDAPVAAGRTRYNALPRTTIVTLDPSEYSTLTYACDGQTFAIAVTDPFGALRRDKLFQYLKKVLRRNESSEDLIDKKEGGAGLGLFKILYSCHSLVCNVEDGKRTEVMTLLDVRQQMRDFGKLARSVHFFEGKA